MSREKRERNEELNEQGMKREKNEERNVSQLCLVLLLKTRLDINCCGYWSNSLFDEMLKLTVIE